MSLSKHSSASFTVIPVVVHGKHRDHTVSHAAFRYCFFYLVGDRQKLIVFGC